jgi:mono/diheme cytochrome c family protein
VVEKNRLQTRWTLPLLLITFFLLLMGSLFSRGASAAEEDLLTGDPIRGRELFVSKGCLECHAVRGVGGAIGPDLGLKVFNKSVYEIGGILWNHSPLMSQKMAQLGIRRPTFDSSEMLDLISFLFFLNYFDPDADPQKGAQVWVDKECVSCHSMGTEGGKVGPDLGSIGGSVNPVFLAQGMWNHGMEMLETLRQLNLPMPVFRGSEMVDLSAYIRLKNRNPRRQLLNMGNPKQGEQLFRAKGCTSCHRSGGSWGPELGGPQFQATVSQIAGQMWNHLPRMSEQMTRQGIAFPTFSGEQMNDLITYLYSLAYVGKPGDAENGAVVFQQKGCVTCHGSSETEIQGSAPDLTALSMDSALGTIPTMWNHALGMEDQMKERQIAWPRFENSEMADLQAYLRKMKDASVKK